jgi:glycosyltransferase involved in cell wall biosynthesis
MQYRFLMPAATRLTGGPAAILTYGRKLMELGENVSFSIPSSPWHGEPILTWAEDIRPDFRIRRSRSLSSLYGTWNLGSGALKNKTTRKTLCVVFKFISVWLFSRILKNPIITWKAIINTLRILLPFTDLPRWNKNEIVIATLWPTAFISCLRPCQNRIYLMQHYEEVFYPNSDEFSLVRLLCRLSYDLPLVRSANSNWLAETISRVHGVECELVQVNGLVVDFEAVGKSVNSTQSAEGVVKIVAYIRPEPWKGFASIYRAIQVVRERTSIPIELHTFGELSAYWESYVDNSSLYHHENLSYLELSQLISSCDLSITGSWYESFPAMPLEAMACKVPVMCTQEGTEEFAIDGVTATIFEKNNEIDLANKIIEFIYSRRKFIEIAAYAHSRVDEFSWEKAHGVRTNWLLEWQELPVKNFECQPPFRSTSSIPEPPRNFPTSRRKVHVEDEKARLFQLTNDGVAKYTKIRKGRFPNLGSATMQHKFIEFCDYWFI